MIDIQVTLISKSYPNKQAPAVDKVSFSVQKGELFGLIGPDGSGKTSLLRMLTTLLLPDSGNAEVIGFDVVKDFHQIRKRVGYMPGKFSLYQDLTVEENLNFFATLFGTRVDSNFDMIKDIYLQLAPFKDRRAGKLSGGMKQKLALCCALIHKPAVLFLDEPTTGVDPVSRREFWDILKKLKYQGITVLVSTPYMDEAALCEKIALIQNGKIMSVNTPDTIIDQFRGKLYGIRAHTMGRLLADLRTLPYISSCNAFGQYHHFTFQKDDESSMQILTDDLALKGYLNPEIKLIPPSIEDCFIQLMNQNAS